MADQKQNTLFKSNRYGLNKDGSPKKLVGGIESVRTILLLLFLSIIIAVVYSNTLRSPFIFDDTANIVNNPHIRVTKLTREAIKNAGFKGEVANRPVANISFALNYYFHRYNLTGYHLVNILIHITSCLLLYFFVKNTLSLPTLRSRYKHYEWMSFFAALVWGVHPLHIQSVTYIVQRMNSLAAMFYLASMLFYVKARLIEGKRIKWLLLGSSALAGLLAIGSKENAAMLPVFIFLYEWYFFQSLDCSWLKQHRFRIAGVLLALALFTFLFLHTEASQMVLSLYKYQHFTLKERVLTEFRVVIYYISLLIFPHPSRLNLDYDFPLSHSLVDPITTLLSMLTIAGLIVAAIYITKKNRLLSYCILWFLGNIVIESSVIGLAIIFEHRTYLPSMLVSVLAVAVVFRYIASKHLRIGLISVLVVVFSVWTYDRNKVWGHEVIFWKDCVTKSPNKARPRNELAAALQGIGRLEEAVGHYEQALRINPDYLEAHIGLGVILRHQGKLKDAIAHYEEALRIDNKFIPAYYNIGIILLNQGMIKEAFTKFEETVQINPDFAEGYYTLGYVCMGEGRFEKAIGYFKEALRKSPSFAEAHNNLGVILRRQGNVNEAIGHFKKALMFKPAFKKARANLAVCIRLAENSSR